MHSLPFRVCAIAAAPVCGKDWYSILLDTALKRIARCPFFCIAGGRWHCTGRLELFQVTPENEESFLQLSKALRIFSKTATRISIRRCNFAMSWKTHSVASILSRNSASLCVTSKLSLAWGSFILEGVVASSTRRQNTHSQLLVTGDSAR